MRICSQEVDEMRCRTILFGPRVYLLAANSVPSPGEGQHLDAVVGVFLQPFKLQRRLCGSDVLDLAQL